MCKVRDINYVVPNLSPFISTGEVTETKTLNYLNGGNPIDKCKVYSRTNNVKVYCKRQSCKELTMILDQEVFVSGLVDDRGDLFICFQESV